MNSIAHNSQPPVTMKQSTLTDDEDATTDASLSSHDLHDGGMLCKSNLTIA